MFWFIPVILGSALAGGVAGVAVACICEAISELITPETISDEIRAQEEFKNAAKAFVKSKDVRSVNINIFDAQNEEIGSLELSSDEGVSSALYVGQMIDLRY